MEEVAEPAEVAGAGAPVACSGASGQRARVVPEGPIIGLRRTAACFKSAVLWVEVKAEITIVDDDNKTVIMIMKKCLLSKNMSTRKTAPAGSIRSSLIRVYFTVHNCGVAVLRKGVRSRYHRRNKLDKLFESQINVIVQPKEILPDGGGPRNLTFVY